jgi:cyanoexosortase B-associated protein
MISTSSRSASPLPQGSPLTKLLIVLFILSIAAFIAIPNYFTGNWVWKNTPKLENVKELKAIQSTGLALPGWKTLEQGKVDIGGHKWSIQAIVPEAEAQNADLETAPVLMMRPQTWQRDMPQVDWVDVNGAQRWTADSVQSLKFSVPGSDQPVEVKARFLRGWHERKTYAVLQWYAWKTGGSPAPAAWFLTDQLAQLRDRRRANWVAVSILIPIQPLGDINTVKSQAETLGKLVQSTLATRAL